MEVIEIAINDKKYPEKLRTIKNPPKKLYVLGNIDILNDDGIAIVGSRDCTKKGAENARFFSANIAKSGFTVISGLAKGIDAKAHLGALEVGGKTIAVLGNGPKYIFPAENEETYKRILKNGGAIVSEYPEDTHPTSDRFRARNRIVSGLSLGVLIVEAEARSGTTITARKAREQFRKVYCIPSSRDNRKGVGTNILIQKGAKLVLEPIEIIADFKKNIEKQITIEELEQMNEKYLELSKVKEEYRGIYKAIKEEASINEISKKTKIDISELYQKLFLMEIEGLIEQYKNKYRIKQA
ncbi:MAG: DNA-protecting protein DprA [Clostridia bacterium]|jgi:DNA processing protein|nr:DNA-protecting protein DprA [Clostridia bacterium]